MSSWTTVVPQASSWADVGGRRVLPAGPGVLLVKDVRIPMRDGTRLAADLYVPEAADEAEAMKAPGAIGATPTLPPLPVVMDYIPYRKDEVAPIRARMYHEIARHGYVAARVDIRGTGGSEGFAVDEYVAQEQADGYDAIEWLAAQPWSDGHVNMIGISYGGFTALQVAAEQPPHLTSIIPIDFTDDRYTDDCHYRGGCLRMYYDIAWYGTRMIAWNAMPPDPAIEGDWAAIWQERLAGSEPYFLAWLRHQVDGPYWRQGSIAGREERIRCPTFLIGGWADGYPNPPLRVYERLTVPKRVWIGPWNHNLPDDAIPGPRIDFLGDVVRWLDHWCKGIDTGMLEEPPILVYMQTAQEPVPDRLDSAGRWRAEQAWPVPGAREQTLALGTSGSLAEGGDGEAGVDSFTYDPTVGIAGGLWSGGVPFGLPADQRVDEARSLVYTSAPLDEELAILGRPRANLWVSSSAAIVAFVASLSDVAPDGTSQLVCKGLLNVTRRDSLTEPAPLPPGEVVELAIDLDTTGWVFQAGHRIRLSIASADFPNVWPTPEPATNQVHRGRERRSRLVLPEVPLEGSARPPDMEPSTVPVLPPATVAPAASWQTARDELTGRASMSLSAAQEFVLPGGTRIARDQGAVCDTDPRDPARSSARGWHVNRTTGAGGTIEGRADVAIRSTATDFHVTIDLRVSVNDAVHFSRTWTESIRRSLL